MTKLKIKLERNLRRSILQGHPWVYKDAIQSVKNIDSAQLAQVFDSKGELAWAIFDPHSPLCLRILSTDKTSPNESFFKQRFNNAYGIRQSIKSGQTSGYRLFNGEGDLLPGLVCDIYDQTAVVQFDGLGPSQFWDKKLIVDWLLSSLKCKTVIEKNRRNSERSIEHLAGESPSTEVTILENNAIFKVNLEKGQKTGFFLDQRENRNYIRQVSRGKSLLNLFSYSGGFSINAGLGHANKVTSVDISQGAIDLAKENWQLNQLKSSIHEGLTTDVFEYLANEKSLWDHIIVDPPSMSHSENQKSVAFAKYVDLFAASAKRVRSGGELSVSSCSSHIHFSDFFEIISESLSKSRRKGQILRVSGQGSDHPFPHACPELRYLKFVHLVLD